MFFLFSAVVSVLQKTFLGLCSGLDFDIVTSISGIKRSAP